MAITNGSSEKIADKTNKSYCRLPRVALFCFHLFSYLRLGHQWNLVSNAQWQAIVCCASRRRKAAGRQLNPIICGGLILCICIFSISCRGNMRPYEPKGWPRRDAANQRCDSVQAAGHHMYTFVHVCSSIVTPKKKQRTISGLS